MSGILLDGWGKYLVSSSKYLDSEGKGSASKKDPLRTL